MHVCTYIYIYIYSFLPRVDVSLSSNEGAASDTSMLDLHVAQMSSDNLRLKVIKERRTAGTASKQAMKNTFKTIVLIPYDIYI